MEGAGPLVVVGLVREQVSDVEEAGVATQLVVDGTDLLGERPRQRRQVGQVGGVPLEAVLDGLAVVGEGVEQHAVGAEAGAELGRDALERLVDVDGRADGATDVEDELLHLEHGRLLVDEPGVGPGEVVEVAREHAHLEGALLLVGHRDDVLLRLATHHLPEPRERAADGAVHPEARRDEHEDHCGRDGDDDAGRDGRGLARVDAGGVALGLDARAQRLVGRAEAGVCRHRPGPLGCARGAAGRESLQGPAGRGEPGVDRRPLLGDETGVARLVGARELLAPRGRREVVQLRVDSGLDRQRVERGGEATGRLPPGPLGAGHVEQDGAVGLPRGSEREGERADRRALRVDRRDGDDRADGTRMTRMATSRRMWLPTERLETAGSTLVTPGPRRSPCGS